MSNKKQNIQAEIKIASGHSSKEVQLYNFIRLLHIIVKEQSVGWVKPNNNYSVQLLVCSK